MTFNRTSVALWAIVSLVCFTSGPEESLAQPPLEPADLRRIAADLAIDPQPPHIPPERLLLLQHAEQAKPVAEKYSPAQLVSYANHCTRENAFFYAAVLTHHADNLLVQELATKAYWADEDDGNLAHLAPHSLWLLSHAPVEDVRTRTEALMRRLLETPPSRGNPRRFRSLCHLLAVAGDESTEQVLNELAQEWARRFPGRGFGQLAPGDIRYERHMLAHKLRQPEGNERRRWQENELIYYRLQFELQPAISEEIAYGDLVQRTLKSGIELPPAFVRSKIDEPSLAQPLAIGLAAAYGYDELYDELIHIAVENANVFAVNAVARIGSPEARQGLLRGIRPGRFGNQRLARAVAGLKHQSDLERLQSFADDERFRESDREYFQVLVDRYGVGGTRK